MPKLALMRHNSLVMACCLPAEPDPHGAGGFERSRARLNNIIFTKGYMARRSEPACLCMAQARAGRFRPSSLLLPAEALAQAGLVTSHLRCRYGGQVCDDWQKVTKKS